MPYKRKIVCRYCRKHIKKNDIKNHKECKKIYNKKELDELKDVILEKAINRNDKKLADTIKYIIQNRK